MQKYRLVSGHSPPPLSATAFSSCIVLHVIEKSLEDSGLLINALIKQLKMKQKDKGVDFL